jgi:hypothetical protein
MISENLQAASVCKFLIDTSRLRLKQRQLLEYDAVLIIQRSVSFEEETCIYIWELVERVVGLSYSSTTDVFGEQVRFQWDIFFFFLLDVLDEMWEILLANLATVVFRSRTMLKKVTDRNETTILTCTALGTANDLTTRDSKPPGHSSH